MAEPRSEPDMGNPSVRDRRGASGNVTHGGTRLPRRNRKGGAGHSPPNCVARPDSIPTNPPYGILGCDGNVGIIRSPISAITLPDPDPDRPSRIAGGAGKRGP